MIYDTNDNEINELRDPLMIISTTLELMSIQYEGLMDKTIQEHLERIEKASQRINKIILELQQPRKICKLFR